MDLLVAAVARPASPVRAQRTTVEQRWSVIALHKDNRTNTYIHKHLGISQPTVRAILARYAATGSPMSGSRSGRPRCTTEATDTFIAVVHTSSHSLPLARSFVNFSWIVQSTLLTDVYRRQDCLVV